MWATPTKRQTLANDHVRLISGDAVSGMKTARLPERLRSIQLTVSGSAMTTSLSAMADPGAEHAQHIADASLALLPNINKRRDHTYGEKRAPLLRATGSMTGVAMGHLPQELMKSILVGDLRKIEAHGHLRTERGTQQCSNACSSAFPSNRFS